MRKHYIKSKHKGPSKATKTIFAVLLFLMAIVLFFYGVVWFRSQAPINKLENTDTLDNSVVVDVTDTSNEETPRRRAKEELQLSDVSGGVSSGVGSREIEDSVFRHTVVANLPELEEGAPYFYEGWLVREHPFDFFSTGKMVLWEDGRFALTWEGKYGEDYKDYNKVVITLEPDDNDPDPAKHILEGEFTE